MRYSLLDIVRRVYRFPAQTSPMLGTQIQPATGRVPLQHDRKDQLCFPPVSLKGDSYRLKDRDLGRIPNDDTT